MTEKIKGAGGRPKFQIDYELVKELAELMCTHEEIASVLGCSAKTLARDAEFCLVHKKGMENGKMSLRRAQFTKAVTESNTVMQIWLGKQYLNQSEPRDKDPHEEESAPPVSIHFDVKAPVSEVKITRGKGEK